MKFTLTDAGGPPISPTLAAQLSSDCGATVTLADQAPVCAVYDPVKATFIATLKSPKTLTVGSTVLLTTTVTLGTATIATGSTPITVTK